MLRSVGSLLFLSLASSCTTAPLTYQQLKECKVASSQVREVKKLADKGFPLAQVCEGKILLKKGKNKEARSYLLKAYRKLKGKEKGKAAYLIGLTLKTQDKRKEAREWFWKAEKELYPNKEFFKLTDYLTLKELKEIEKLGKKEPLLYLYLADYLREKELFKGALFYYQIAIRYGVKEARLGSAICLFKLGNWKLARSILITEYKRGSKKAARIMGKLLMEKAFTVGKGKCLLLSDLNPKEFIKLRVEQIKEKAELFKEASKWFKKAGDKKEEKRSLKMYRLYSFDEKKEFPQIEELSTQQLIRLCEMGELWAEYLLAQSLKTRNSQAALILYRKLFK